MIRSLHFLIGRPLRYLVGGGAALSRLLGGASGKSKAGGESSKENVGIDDAVVMTELVWVCIQDWEQDGGVTAGKWSTNAAASRRHV